MTQGAWIAIAAMVAMTVLAKTMGFFILGRVPLTARLRRGLEALPGGVILATVVPITLQSGVAGLAGLFAAAVMMVAFRKDWLAVAGGLAVVGFVRAAF